MARKQPKPLPIADEAQSLALAESIVRLDQALEGLFERMGELRAARQQRQGGKRVPTGRVKTSTGAVKPGTGSLRRLDGAGEPVAPVRRAADARPATRPMRQATVEDAVAKVVPALDAEAAADRLLATLEAQAERMGADAPPTAP